MKIMQKNHPIATVIKNYLNKKSKMVTDARKEIQRRFHGLDWKDQKTILNAFLESGKVDRVWAYSMLLDWWDPIFEPKVRELWETYQEYKCAWVIMRHFPKDYIKNHIEEFDKGGRDYYFICRRLSEDADFTIDKSKLSPEDYLMALYHGHRHIEDEEAKDVLFTIVSKLCMHTMPYMELPTFHVTIRGKVFIASDFRKVSIGVYYLEEMGKMDVVEAFRSWEKDVLYSVIESDEYEALCKIPLSDHNYGEELAFIVQKHLYHALPVKYKTLTDEEYDKKMVDTSASEMGFSDRLKYDEYLDFLNNQGAE